LLSVAEKEKKSEAGFLEEKRSLFEGADDPEERTRKKMGERSRTCKKKRRGERDKVGYH